MILNFPPPAPSGAEIPLVVRETSQRLLDLEYTPREVGIHGVQVELEGVVVPISPITVSAYDISKIRVREIKDGVVNQQNRILGGLCCMLLILRDDK